MFIGLSPMSFHCLLSKFHVRVIVNWLQLNRALSLSLSNTFRTKIRIEVQKAIWLSAVYSWGASVQSTAIRVQSSWLGFNRAVPPPPVHLAVRIVTRRIDVVSYENPLFENFFFEKSIFLDMWPKRGSNGRDVKSKVGTTLPTGR